MALYGSVGSFNEIPFTEVVSIVTSASNEKFETKLYLLDSRRGP